MKHKPKYPVCYFPLCWLSVNILVSSALDISLRIVPFSTALIIFTIELGFVYALFTFQFENCVDVKSVCSEISHRNNMQCLLYLHIVQLTFDNKSSKEREI